MSDHVHRWGADRACLDCAAQRCKKWQCALPRVTGASVCEKHLNGRSEVVPRSQTVRVITYSLPAARREDPLHLAEATR